MPGWPRGRRCCALAGRGLYLDPSREPWRGVFGRLAGGRDGRDVPRDSADDDDWPAASADDALHDGKVHSSTRAPGSTGGRSKTTPRSHRRGNVVERKGLERSDTPGPASRTGHGRPSHAKVTIVVLRLPFLGPPPKPRSLLTVGVSFFHLRNAQTTPRHGAPSARMMLTLTPGGNSENYVSW